MKKLFGIITVVLLVSFMSNAQPYRVYTLSYGLLTAYTTETQYVDLSGWASIDSISVTALAKGGVGNLCEVDSVVFYVGSKTKNGYGFTSSAYLGVCALDPAASVETSQLLLTALGATPLSADVLRGVSMVKCVVYPSDETSVAPSYFDVLFQVHGVMEPKR